MLPHSAVSGLRIFTMNMRDYRDSSPYTDEELDAMSSPDVEAQASVVRGIGQDIANFVAYVCKTKGVPRLVRDGEQKTGGVVLMTWSRGNIGLLSILGDPRTLEGETKDIFSLYVRKMVLYGTPRYSTARPSQHMCHVLQTRRRAYTGYFLISECTTL